MQQRLTRALQLTADFYNHIAEEHLSVRIPGAPSNTIGEQAWCIVGARESYLKALQSGGWRGFSCSLQETRNKDLIVDRLQRTATEIEGFLHGDTHILMDIWEHEVQHHGQLIRLAYANRLTFPRSWNERYTV